MPDHIQIHGACVHNLKNIDIDIPLGKLVAISGLSGSGKSSLALGVLYAEGSRRYLEALSAYTRRHITQAAEAKIDSVENIPAALALRQRPAVPGVRSTFGTMTELLNSLRLMYSRLGSHCCPSGHYLPPTTDVAAGKELVCPVCGANFNPPSAEAFSFNSDGSCPRCSGTGTMREIDRNKLVPDATLTLQEKAVEPWKMFGLHSMVDVAAKLGVRTDVPFQDLSEEEKRIVIDGEPVKVHLSVPSKDGKLFEVDVAYRNAYQSVEVALKRATTENSLVHINKYLTICECPDCHGTRFNSVARSTLLCGKDLPSVLAMTLEELVAWIATVPVAMPEPLRPMAKSITAQFQHTAKRLMELGLGYLTLDRAASTLSTGERQRVQLARAVRNRTTGVLYVLDEPSIGLHPSNVDGLLGLVQDLVTQGNSVVLVDHDIQVLKAADWLIEMGPGAGNHGGEVLTQGTVTEVANSPQSLIGPFLRGTESPIIRKQAESSAMFEKGRVRLSTAPLHTVHALDLELPKGRLIAVTGVSGSGKTTLVLESLIPALQASIAGKTLPAHIHSVDPGGIGYVNMIDATPIGTNVRSTVATYSGILDDLRRLYANTPDGKSHGYKLADFSYNTGSLRCPACDGTGQITMDVQFLPDVEIVCPDCGGTRYKKEAGEIRWFAKKDKTGITLPELMALTVEQALEKMMEVKKVRDRLQILSDLGLGYLTLGEATPALSGGEAQRLKLAAEMGKAQDGTLFVFDEPTIGLHPLDVRTLLDVFQRLLDSGATVLVIEHDLDMIANADYVIDMGPGGGKAGGQIVATGAPVEIARCKCSITGKYLKKQCVVQT